VLSFKTACIVTGVLFAVMSLAMVLGIGILTVVHIKVLATNADPVTGQPNWSGVLYLDTGFFSWVTLYWLAVAVASRASENAGLPPSGGTQE
jgi:hypothetical protein